jgi:hypothetical protein
VQHNSWRSEETAVTAASAVSAFGPYPKPIPLILTVLSLPGNSQQGRDLKTQREYSIKRTQKLFLTPKFHGVAL